MGGLLADKFGGALVTAINFVAMAGAAGLVLAATRQASLPMFVLAFVLLVTLTGIGNGSTYKMIPAIFRATTDTPKQARRLSGALIGIAGAIGAFGGVLVNIALRQSFLHTGNAEGAYITFIAFYLACLALTVGVYLRPGKRLVGV